MSHDILKQQAGQAVVNYLLPLINDQTVIGIGTGSTINYLIQEIAARVKNPNIFVPSSITSSNLLAASGIQVQELNSVTNIDYYIDSADEIDNQLNMIKGGGAAMTGEKILASMSKNFFCIAHSTKYVKQLGNFSVAVEVLPMARSLVGRDIVALGATPIYREGVITDNGNIIIDIVNPDFVINQDMEIKINRIPGVVDNGIFCRYSATKLFLSGPEGVKIIDKGINFNS